MKQDREQRVPPSSGTCAAAKTCWKPAFATIASSRPNRARAASTTARFPSRVVRSPSAISSHEHVPAVLLSSGNDSLADSAVYAGNRARFQRQAQVTQAQSRAGRRRGSDRERGAPRSRRARRSAAAPDQPGDGGPGTNLDPSRTRSSGEPLAHPRAAALKRRSASRCLKRSHLRRLLPAFERLDLESTSSNRRRQRMRRRRRRPRRRRPS